MALQALGVSVLVGIVEDSMYVLELTEKDLRPEELKPPVRCFTLAHVGFSSFLGFYFLINPVSRVRGRNTNLFYS